MQINYLWRRFCSVDTIPGKRMKDRITQLIYKSVNQYRGRNEIDRL